MTTVRRHTHVPFTSAQMYRLVNDVATYPQFLPWCTRAEILEQSPTCMHARLHLRKGPLDTSFATENRLELDSSITMRLLDGPFSHFQGHWRFVPAEAGCIVSLDLEFDFRGRVLSKVLATAFKPIADSMVAAFKARAFVTYAG